MQQPKLIIDRERFLQETVPVCSLPLRSTGIPFNDTVWIAQHEGGYLGQESVQTYIASPYFRNCSMVAVWNQENHDAAMFHVSNKTNVYSVFTYVKDWCQDGHWSITMAGGTDHGIPQAIYQEYRYNWLLAELLFNFSKENKQCSFCYERPSGKEPTSDNDRSYMLNRITGSVEAIDNALVAETEYHQPELLGPHFTHRFTQANIFPYLMREAPDCTIAFIDGAYTGIQERPCSLLQSLLAVLKVRYIALLEQHNIDPLYLRRNLDKDILRRISYDFLTILKDVIPDNDYLLYRCQHEDMMRLYMQEALLVYWGYLREHPIEASS